LIRLFLIYFVSYFYLPDTHHLPPHLIQVKKALSYPTLLQSAWQYLKGKHIEWSEPEQNSNWESELWQWEREWQWNAS